MSGARLLKVGMLLVAAVVVLLLAAIVVLPHLVDVNRYAPLLSSQIQSFTGRAAKFGPMTLRVLPAPALHVAPVTLAEGARYPGRDFIRIEAIDVRLRLWPLFRGRVEFGAIVVDRPTVTVIRDGQGRWNFDDLLERTAALRKQGGATATSPSGPAAPSIGVGEAVLRGGRLLVYDDAVVPGRRSELTVGPIDARLAGFGLEKESDADLSLGLGKSRLAVTARLSGEGERQVVEAKIDRSRLETADLVPLIPWLGVARPAGLQVGGGADVEGKATIPVARPETLQFDGTITLDNLHYKDAGMTRPVEKVGGRLKVGGNRAAWEGFTATVGKSDLSGALTVEDYLHPRVGFALTSKRLDLNELVALYAPAPSSGRTSSPSAPAASGGSEGDLLSQVSAAGTLKAEALRFQTFDLTGVTGKVTLRDGVASLSDLDAKIADGTVRGAAALDLGRPKPGYRLETSLQKVDVNALATAYDPGLKDLLRGRLGGAMSLVASGADLDAILASARGTARIQIADGAVTSISILKQLAALLEMAGGKGIGKDETPFDLLQGNFVIADRRASTSDLTLDSKDLDLAGTGHVGLDAALDLGVTAKFSEEASRGLVEKTPKLKAILDPQGLATVHLLARGPLAGPQVTLDTRAQVRQVQEQKKEQIKEKVRDRLLDFLGGGKKKDEPPPAEPPPPPPPPR